VPRCAGERADGHAVRGRRPRRALGPRPRSPRAAPADPAARRVPRVPPGQGSLEWARDLLQPRGYERFPLHDLAIAEDSFGNEVVLETEGDRAGSIWFWDHETGDLHFVASTLQQLLDRLEADFRPA
jgi:hypothetical protein